MKTPNSAESKRPWVEPVAAVIMAMTTLGTAWSSYQSSRWTSTATRNANQSARLEREAHGLQAQGTVIMSAHAAQLMAMINAQLLDQKKVADFYSTRMAPEVRKAYDAWLLQKPFENPNAAPHPLVPELYEPRFSDDVKKLLAEAADRSVQGINAGRNAASYLANTVLFATVLFFAGTASKFDHRRVRQSALVFAVICFLIAIVRTAWLPVA